jgi:hypothetical protein
MAAPTHNGTAAGVIVQTGSGSLGCSGATNGGLCFVAVMQDGTAAGAVTCTVGGTDATKLDGSAGTDLVGVYDIGSAVAALLHIYVCRTITVSNTDFNVSTTGNDLYANAWNFKDCAVGTTLADVIENSTAGTVASEAGTSVTVPDVGVTTLGADRLAVNFCGINDDGTGLAAPTGMTGGTWALMSTVFESSTGTDGTIAAWGAAMATAGTIDGGTDTITSDAWGVAGFAIIGTTAAAVVPRHSAINFQDPGLL